MIDDAVLADSDSVCLIRSGKLANADRPRFVREREHCRRDPPLVLGWKSRKLLFGSSGDFDSI